MQGIKSLPAQRLQDQRLMAWNTPTVGARQTQTCGGRGIRSLVEWASLYTFLLISHGRPDQSRVVLEVAHPLQRRTIDGVDRTAIYAAMQQHRRVCAGRVSLTLLVQEPPEVGLIVAEVSPENLGIKRRHDFEITTVSAAERSRHRGTTLGCSPMVPDSNDHSMVQPNGPDATSSLIHLAVKKPDGMLGDPTAASGGDKLQTP